MKKHLGTAIKFALSLGVGIFIVWFTFSRLSQEDRDIMRSAFANANYWWLALGAMLNLSSNFFRAERWRMLLKPLGYRPHFLNTFLSIIVMYFANLLFPRLGEVLRCEILRRYEKIPLDKSIGTMVTERVVDVLSLLVVGGVLILVEKERFYQSYAETQEKLKGFGNSPVFSYIFYGIVAAVILFVAYKVITDKTWIGRLTNFMRGILEGLKSVFKTGNMPLFLFHTAAIWACFIFNTYVCFFALTETAGLSVLAAMGATFFGALAYTAVQGGVGAYPLIIQYFLLAYGIQATTGFAFGWLAWSFVTAMVLVVGMIALIALTLFNRSDDAP
ncbi:MAG: lysylphosphatidylglycerol synthase transmembrane domain-containing protein [Chitinophagales bacterium]|nr:lysylphosphatidylglycerol synthase transmembrane domain-containing protein [Chitinophagales bacterium]